jgi:hypothetical protein
MEGGRNITAILTGGIVKGVWRDCSDGLVLGGWQKYNYLFSKTSHLASKLINTIAFSQALM